jgi:hypothetical protein
VQVHRNVKTTRTGRVLLIERVTELGWTMRAAAAASGVSMRTAYKWLARYRQEATRASRIGQVFLIGDRTGSVPGWSTGSWGSGPAIAYRTGIPRGTVGNVLRRHGLGRLPPLHPRPPVRRAGAAGGTCPRGYKGVGPHSDGRPPHPRRPHAMRVRGIGWEHVYVCVDDASRLAYKWRLLTTSKPSRVRNSSRDATRSGAGPLVGPHVTPSIRDPVGQMSGPAH